MAERSPQDADQRLLSRVLAGTASADDRVRVRELLRTDPEAQKTFQLLVESERALSGGPLDVPSAVELDAILPAVLDAAAAPATSLATSTAPSVVAPGMAAAHRRPPTKTPLGIRLSFFAFPAVAAAIAFLAWPARKDPSPDDFAARGASSAATFSLFCVDHGAPRELLGERMHCARGASLVVGLPTSDAGARVQSLGIVDARSARHETAVPDATVPPDGLVPTSIDLKEAVAPGRARVELTLVHTGGVPELRTRAIVVDAVGQP